LDLTCPADLCDRRQAYESIVASNTRRAPPPPASVPAAEAATGHSSCSQSTPTPYASADSALTAAPSHLDDETYKDFERAYPGLPSRPKAAARLEAILARVRGVFRPVVTSGRRPTTSNGSGEAASRVMSGCQSGASGRPPSASSGAQPSTTAAVRPPRPPLPSKLKPPPGTPPQGAATPATVVKSNGSPGQVVAKRSRSAPENPRKSRDLPALSGGGCGPPSASPRIRGGRQQATTAKETVARPRLRQQQLIRQSLPLANVQLTLLKGI